jgi:CRP-like cAMP-binding protein
MRNAQSGSILANKLQKFLPLTPEEQQRLADIQSVPLKVTRGKKLTEEGQTGHKAFVLHAGWACSYKDLRDGGRQIISFPIAGDIVGLRSVLLRTADHSFSPLTDAVVSSVDGAQILQTINDFPRLGSAILWAASRDEAMVVEHLVSVGRRSATERTAHFFVELAERLSSIAVAAQTEFSCPFTQFVLADALGLTAIHVNRVLWELGLLTMRKGNVQIHDLNRLRKLAGFQGGYLDTPSATSALGSAAAQVID